MHLLIIEDDTRLRDVLGRLLGGDRHLVDFAATGREGLEIIETTDGVDAVVLDVGLPDMSGFDVARQIRRGGAGSVLPILMLTARDAVSDRVSGLDAGADDYLVKPFAYEELAARLRALVRRRANGATEGQRLRAGPIELDEARRLVMVNGAGLELSQREFALLECLLRHPDQVLTRDQLLDHAWPFGVAVTLNSVDTYVYFLRRKLGPAGSQIQSVRGVGYRMLSS